MKVGYYMVLPVTWIILMKIIHHTINLSKTNRTHQPILIQMYFIYKFFLRYISALTRLTYI